jgi:phosphoglycerate dehydrogenase-like enzyme
MTTIGREVFGKRLGLIGLGGIARETAKRAGASFADTPNLLLTPHIAGVTEESNVRVSDLTAKTVRQHLDGSHLKR